MDHSSSFSVKRPVEIPKWMWEYAERQVKEYNFDSSHDMEHFVNVFYYVSYLISQGERYSLPWCGDHPDGKKRSRRIVLQAAFLHDLIDRKYVDEKDAIIRLRREFIDQNYPDADMIDVIDIITHMSFSKRKERRNQGKEDFKSKSDALAIVCDADILDAYRPERVIAYQNSKYPNDPETARKWSKTILVKRVLRYLPENYLFTATARKIAEQMHKLVEKYVVEHFPDDVEMFDY